MFGLWALGTSDLVWILALSRICFSFNNLFTSLSLSFLICKMKTTKRVHQELKWMMEVKDLALHYKWQLELALLFIFHLIYLHLLIFGCSGFIAMCGLLSNCSAWASHLSGFSCYRARAPGPAGFSSCGMQAQLPHGIWNPPGLGIQPVSPALAGRLLTTGSLGKSCLALF